MSAPLTPALPFWLALPLLIFGLVVPGFLTLQLVLTGGKSVVSSPSSALAGREKAFWTLVLSVFEAGWLSLLLAEMGLFSIGLVGLILAGWSLGAGSWLWRRGYRADWWRAQLRWQRPTLDGWLLAGLLAGSAVLFFLAPHETLLGSQDSGVYYSSGAVIARTGALVIDDPLLRTVGSTARDPQIGSKILPQVLQGPAKKEDRFLFVRHLRLPGFFVRDNEAGLDTGEVVPQFFHLYPAYLALGGGLFGINGIALVTPFLGLLSVFAVYLAAWRLFPARRQRWIALFAGLFLALNALQVWFARQSLWEMLGQFLLFTGIYAFCLLLRPLPVDLIEEGNGNEGQTLPDERVAILGGLGAGLALGLICLAHAQFPFLVWPLVPYFIWMRLTRRWGAAQWWLLVSFSLLLLHSVIHIRLFSLGYFEGIYHHKIIDYLAILHFIVPPVAVGFFALIIIDAMPGRVRAFEDWVRRRWRFVAGGLAFLTLAYLLYNYFIRVNDLSTDGQGNLPTRLWSLSSYIGAPTSEGPERSLVRLGWYFSPVGIILIFAGLGWLILRRLNGSTAFFLALLAGISLIFLDTNYTQEQYVYSLRRYVVVTVPAFSILLAYALFETLPDLAGLVARRLPRPKRLTYARTAGGGNVAFAIAQEPPLQTNEPAEKSGNVVTSGRANGIGRGLGWLLAVGIALFLAWTGRTIFLLPQYGAGDGQPGLISQMNDLAGRFGPHDLLLFAGERDRDGKVATPLTYIYGHPAFVLTEALKNEELAGLLQRWEAQGYTIKALLGPNGGRFSPPGYDLKQQSAVTLKLRQLEELSTQKPNNIQLNSLSYEIYEVRRVGASANFATSAGSGRPDTAGGWNLTLGQNDPAALVEGFYETERDPEGAAYRWTAQSGILRVPCLTPDGVAGRLSLTLAGGQRPASKGVAQVSVYLSNYRYSNATGKRLSLGKITLGTGPQTFNFDLPAGADPLSCNRPETANFEAGKAQPVNSLFVWLEADPKTPFVPGRDGDSPDFRQLSFKVYGLNLTAK